MRNFLISVLFFFFSVISLFSQRGMLDASFCNGLDYNQDGYYICPDDDEHDFMYDGKVVGNDFYSLGLFGTFDVACLMISKFSLDGIPDESFDSNPDDDILGTKMLCAEDFDDSIIAISAFGLVVDSEDNFICIAYIDRGNTNSIGLIRLLPDGEIDVTFGVDGLKELPNPNLKIYDTGLYIEKEGVLYISFSHVSNNAEQYGMYSCGLNGDLYESFGTDGLLYDVAPAGLNRVINSIEYHNDNLYCTILEREVISGIYYDSYFIRSYSSNGGDNLSFGTNGVLQGPSLDDQSYPVSSAFVGDNFFIAFLSYDNGFGDFSSYLLKIDAFGVVDEQYGVDGIYNFADSDGFVGYEIYNIQNIYNELYVSGEDYSEDNDFGFFISAMNAEGEILPDFGTFGFTKDFFTNYEFDNPEDKGYHSFIEKLVPIPNSKDAIIIGNAWKSNGNFAFGKLQIVDELIPIVEIEDKGSLLSEIRYSESDVSLYIEFDQLDFESFEIVVSDLAGKILFEKGFIRNNQSEISIPLSAYINSDGMYSVSIFSNMKFMKIHKFVFFKGNF